MAHKDLRRARTTNDNIIPTSTGAAKAIGLVLPDLVGKFNGMAFRVPTVSVSVVDLTAEVERPTTKEEINSVLKQAAEAPGWLGKVFNYTEEPLVSMDLKGDPASTTIDALSTDVIGGPIRERVAGGVDEHDVEVARNEAVLERVVEEHAIRFAARVEEPRDRGGAARVCEHGHAFDGLAVLGLFDVRIALRCDDVVLRRGNTCPERVGVRFVGMIDLGRQAPNPCRAGASSDCRPPGRDLQGRMCH